MNWKKLNVSLAILLTSFTAFSATVIQPIGSGTLTLPATAPASEITLEGILTLIEGGTYAPSAVVQINSGTGIIYSVAPADPMTESTGENILNNILTGGTFVNPWPIVQIPSSGTSTVQATAPMTESTGELLANQLAGGIITVPSGVFIQPNQAFVTGMAQQTATIASGSNGMFFGNIGATSFTINDGGEYIFAQAGYIQATNPGDLTLDFSGNSVTDPAAVELMLNALYSAGIANDTINVNGGSMAPPEGQLEAQDEIYTLTIPTVPIPDPAANNGGYASTIYYSVTTPAFLGITFYSSVRIAFDSNTAAADSYQTSDLLTGNLILVIGISDAPSSTVMAATLVSLMTTLMWPGTIVQTGANIQVDDSTSANFPYSFSDSSPIGSGVTVVENQVGQAYVPSPNTQNLLNNGNTVNTN